MDKTELLPCELTENEIRAKADVLAKGVNDYVDMEKKKARRHQVAVEERPNRETNLMDIVRLDTGDVIRTRPFPLTRPSGSSECSPGSRRLKRRPFRGEESLAKTQREEGAQSRKR